MCKFEPVTESLRSVRRDDGTPTGVMVLTPILEIGGGHTVAIGVTGTNRSKRYGVVINGKMLPHHRSRAPLLPSQLEVDKKGGFVLLHGKLVAQLRLA